ncbi:long-chain fatty acid--CoA ligase [Sulfurimonas lithotrophica]|uniref:Long-chain fatty acid--CoA ligase n=1 Tax=Sulfurimonas lithotrophica TaxID=2590022 RepID=A0A5P8P0V8_9BACT|nr:AMP-binding protein [Sulfurimonas lithotrophica]QFR49348.1 long-chain fatty acid--CoA ligase [Sulfurimonas lithotrophica]
MHYPYENIKDFTLRSFLQRSASVYPQRPFVSYVGNTPITYDEFYKNVLHTSNQLKELGIKKDDKVLLLSENMPNWSIAYFSIVYIGAVVVPVLPDFHPSDVHHIIRHAEVNGVFVSEKHQQTIEEFEHKEIDFVINLESLSIIDELSNEKYIQKHKKLAQKNPDNFTDENIFIDDNDLACIIYTSGTTGHSKGVMLTHKNLTTNAMSTHSIIDITPNDIFLSILPLSHVFEGTVGMLVPMLHGSSVQYIKKTPTPSVLLKAFEVAKPTFILSVPLVIEKIYKNKVLSKFNSSLVTKNLYKVPYFRKKLNKIAAKKLVKTFGGRLRFFAIGGAGVPGYVEQFLHEGDFPYIVGYGLTETSPLLCATPSTMKTKIKSTGPSMYGVEIDIRNKHNITGEGEIFARSPSVMIGYYKDKEKTKEVLDADGWFHTGDLGYIDDEGYLFISGRSKNMILGPSGENIYPEQIESIINEHELVLDSLMLEQNGKLIAKIHLDYEKIDELYHGESKSSDEVLENINILLEEMRQEVNSKVSSFSRMVKFEEQREPFIKTPTKKIKRYLYQN